MTPPPSAPFAVSPTTMPAQSSFDWPNFEPFPSHFLGVSSFDASDSNKVRTYLDWSTLFRKWEIPVPFPQVLDDAEWGETARNLLHDANALLDDFLSAGRLRADVVFGVWRAIAEGDQVVVQTGDQPSVRISFPRLSVSDTSTYCLADFIKPAAALNEGESDYIGGYRIQLGADVLEPIRRWEAEPDDYRVFLASDLCALYRSAVADYLHYRLRRFIWAYCDDDDLSNEEVLHGLHQGIRIEIGGPECPDQAVSVPLLRLLGIGEPAFTTDNDGLASACGFFFAHPKSRYYPAAPAGDQIATPL